MDKNGNLFFGFDTLYALNYNGKLIWKKSVSKFGNEKSKIDSDLISDINGNIYFALTQGDGFPLRIIGLNNEGKEIFNQVINSNNMKIASYSPVIGDNRKLYLPLYLDIISIIN